MSTATILRRLAFTAALTFGMAMGATAWGQDTPAPSRTVGSVIGMATLNQDSEKTLRISLLTDDGQVVTVEACPTISMNAGSVNFTLGDRILATGEMTQINGVPILESCHIQLVASGQPQQGYAPQPTPTYVPPDYGAGGYGYTPDYGYYPGDYGYPYYGYSSPYLFNPFFFDFSFGRFRHGFDRDDFARGFRGDHRDGSGTAWHRGTVTTSPVTSSPIRSGAGTTARSGVEHRTTVTPMSGRSPSAWHSSPGWTGSAPRSSAPSFHASGTAHSSAPSFHASSGTHFSAPAFHSSSGGGGGGGGHFGGASHR